MRYGMGARSTYRRAADFDDILRTTKPRDGAANASGHASAHQAHLPHSARQRTVSHFVGAFQKNPASRAQRHTTAARGTTCV